MREFLQPAQRADDLGLEVVGSGDAGAPDAVVVKSARGAVLVFPPVRFPGPFPAPGVPLSRHRALHMSRCGLRHVLMPCWARVRG